jgi:phosphoribosylamine--glycine ligase
MIHESAASNGQVRPNDDAFSRAFGAAACGEAASACSEVRLMNVLLIGSGGREHALAWAMLASPLLTRLYCAPGNAGIAEIADCVALDVADHAAVVRFCRENRIELVVIGPEAPLVAGLADALAAAEIKVFGPSKAAARLEGSKGFTKDFCAEHGIPSAAYARFHDRNAALAYLASQPLPIVVKADGLAAGKGVTVAETQEAAVAAVEACLSGALGDGGVVIEECLVGEEASFFALVDGSHALPLASAQDHKRAFDGDRGPNTGGMGAYSPAPVVTPEIARRTMDEIIWPTVKGMAARGTPCRGVLYAGLMIAEAGPKLIEYNVRFGDPEAQVLMLRLKSDLLSALLATADGVLNAFDVRWHDDAAITVVMAANGYPGDYGKGSEIRGLDAAQAVEGVEIFHAGTARDGGGRLIATGGRVLNVSARGKTLAEARERAYAAVGKIDWPGGFCRSDIGWRALQREEGRS